ncbi:MAG TPA: ATP-binding protein [Cyclobacteriaceae bacterium]|nr:ATP-binding protein [Cyclobacteriaceae bacterium]HPW62949.1 ATP-binding protein [Cyclobacteriaceae bacterium]
MKIKHKVRLGVFALFGFLVVLGGIGLFYINQLDLDTRNILTNNYESLEYTSRIMQASDSLRFNKNAIHSLRTNLKAQEGNITEPGEQELTFALREEVEKLKLDPDDSNALLNLRKHAIGIQQINMKAIKQKSEAATKAAAQATNYLVIVSTIVGILAFIIIVNFPGYVADPIVQLTSGIKAIANKDYEERLHFSRKDEFEELAVAFNLMAEKLDEYEHSNLANILYQKKRIETIINRMTDPVIGLDEKKHIVFANEQSLQLLNLTKEKTIGRYAPDVALYNDLLRKLIQQDENVNKTNLLKIIVNGKENYFSKEIIDIHYTPTGEKENINVGQVILLKNITQYKELDLAKTNFIATISHELKTPIASLQMCAQLISDQRVGVLNEEQQKIVNSLKDETNRLSKLVSELLDLSQVETGNVKLTLGSVSPIKLVEQAIDSIKIQAERNNINLEIDAPNDLPAVKADPEKATWVLINLLSNAIRYTPENGKIEIRVEKDEDQVLFSVQDFGPGIEEKYLSRVFDKFFQVPGTTHGTGLGLAISKEFVEAQNGTITLESKYGYGSTFIVSLPQSKPSL